MFEFGFTKSDVVRAVWAFVGTFIGCYYAMATGFSSIPNMSTAKAAVVALFPSAITAALLAAKNAFLKDGTPLKG